MIAVNLWLRLSVFDVTPRFAAAGNKRKLDDSNSVRNIDLLSEVDEVEKLKSIDIISTVTSLQSDFESWYFAQFGNGAGLNFISNGIDAGYERTEINCLWIGFCAGRLTAKSST